MRQVWTESQKSAFVGFCTNDKPIFVSATPSKGSCQVLRIADFGLITVYDQYASCHRASDMDALLSLLSDKFGDGNVYARHLLEDHRLIVNCSFLMRWADFVKLCRFLFRLLDALREQVGDNLPFLAERIISAWIAGNVIPYVGDRNVAIAHYNTPELLNAAIRSLDKHTPGCRVYVFENSDRKPFVIDKKESKANGLLTGSMPYVEIIDNTRQQLVNFDEELERWPDKWAEDIEKSNYGSAKHSMSVDKLMELIPDGFVLMDSDVLITNDISMLWKKEYACVGSEFVKCGVPQLQPFLCYLNVPKLKPCGISYYNGEKMWALSRKSPNQFYETGAWLLEEVRRHGLPVSYVNIWRYVIHYGHGSWRDRNSSEWLEENKGYWRDV